MNKYDFSSIDHQEFEELSRDILNRVLKIDLQSFKSGKDKGIDLKVASNCNANEVIVQVKHFIKSGFPSLLAKLKNEEVSKVLKLSPSRFIIVTSVPLSDANKNAIFLLFNPYIHNTNDIFGQEDLNKYLLLNDDIVKKYYKLWLTSTTVLQTILNNSVNGRSKFISKKIVKHIGLYAKSQSYYKAVDVLEKNKFLLITGLPGVGKTILSYILTYEFLAKNYSLVYIDQEIEEAEAAFDDNEELKQIFLLDDFLGANYNEIINPKSSHSSIIAFIERVQATPNKYCILNTRTNILNKAKLLSEKLRYSDIEVSKMEVEVKDYNVLDKAKILYKHLLYNDLPIEHINQVFENKKYWEIINHHNYNPRIIEFISSKTILSQVSNKNSYIDCVISNLKNPEKIWLHAFNNQINKDDQFLIYTLFSFGVSVESDFLENAYNSRIDFEISKNGYEKKTNSFNNSIQRLLDSFVSSNRDKDIVSFQFINPSINDFFLNYFLNSKEERLKLIASSFYFIQYRRLIQLYNHYRQDKNQNLITDWIYLIDKIDSLGIGMLFYSNYTGNQKKLMICNILLIMKYWKGFTSSDFLNKLDFTVLKLLKQVDLEEAVEDDFDELLEAISSIHLLDNCLKFIEPIINSLLTGIINKVTTIEQINSVKYTCDLFDIDWDNFIENQENIYVLKNSFYQIISENVNEFIKDEKYNVFDESDYERLKDKTWSQWNSYVGDIGINIEYDENDLFSSINLNELVEYNSERKAEQIFEDSEEYYGKKTSFTNDVDLLFSVRII